MLKSSAKRQVISEKCAANSLEIRQYIPACAVVDAQVLTKYVRQSDCLKSHTRPSSDSTCMFTRVCFGGVGRADAASSKSSYRLISDSVELVTISSVPLSILAKLIRGNRLAFIHNEYPKM
jgi:hypothetical protein